MIKGSIREEDTTIINTYAPNIGAPQYVRQMLVSKVTQSYPTLCDPINCSLPGSSVDGIFQARILEWVAISFSREFS